MKSYKIVAATETVAHFEIDDPTFNSAFCGLPKNAANWIVKQRPELEGCSWTWNWSKGGKIFNLDFMSVGDPVLQGQQ